MADEVDQTERQESLSRDIAIRISQAAIEQDRREICIDCGGRIPEGRVSCRCVDCQTKKEKKNLTRR